MACLEIYFLIMYLFGFKLIELNLKSHLSVMSNLFVLFVRTLITVFISDVDNVLNC